MATIVTGVVAMKVSSNIQGTNEYQSYLELQSNPPVGKYKVTNLFIDPNTGTLSVEYDDTPQT